MSFFEAVARLYEIGWLGANRLRDGQEVGLVRFKEAEEGGQQRRLSGAGTQFVSPDSGQVEESLRPTVIAERCGQRAKRESDGVIWVSVHRG